VTTGDPDVALIADAYVRWGDRFPQRLNGEYALAVLEPSSRRVLLARDVVGTRLLVFGETSAGDVVFGTEAKALLAHAWIRSDPNLDVVAEFLLGGNARATPWDSYFAAVHRVPPGVTVLVGAAGITWRTHDSFDLGRRTIHRKYEMYVEEYRAHFEDAVRRRLRSAHPIGLLVSGGIDSSSILAVAARSSPTDLVPVNFSFPQGSSGNEERFVRELESMLDLDIHRVPMGSGDLESSILEHVRDLEAPTAATGSEARRSAWALMRARGAKAYLAGSWGDQILVDQSYLVDMFDRLAWGGIRRHLSEYPNWMTDVDRSWFLRTFIDDLVRWHVPMSLSAVLRRMHSSFAGIPHDAAWYTDELRDRAGAPPLRPPIGAWSRVPVRPRSLMGRLRNLSSGFAIAWNGSAAAAAGFDDRAPFLDRDLIAYVASVPGDVNTPEGRVRGLHRDALADQLPQVIKDRRDKGDGTEAANTEVAEALPSLVGMFTGASVSGSMGLVQPETVASEVRAVGSRIKRSDDFREGGLIMRLVALEAWLRVFQRDAAPMEE
jgi:asparagine synthase (glutamine-hydrolysing)